MSFYNLKDGDVNINGGSSTYVAGDSIVQNYGPRPSGFERLQMHVAANALHNSGEVSDQPKCHPGTRVAILDHIIAWAATLAYTYPIIWLHGPAGAGKSAILRTIAQLLFERDLLVASFFFFRTATGRNSSERFIATISYQLALSIPATRPHIEQAIERNPLIFSLSLWVQAQVLLISPILAVLDDPSFDTTQYPRIIIVDGLDECNDPDKQCELLDVLCRVLQNLPIPFAMLVASRPEHHIRGAFDAGDLNRHSSRLSLDNSYEPDADIEKFLLDRFSKIQELHPLRTYLPTSWPLQAVIDKLVAQASGQFIYASTVDKFVSSIRHNPADRLEVLLGILDRGTLKPFEQLDALYSTIFHTIDPVDLAGTLRVLGVFLVPYSSGPPSPRYLEFLLGLARGDVRRLLFDLESLLTIGKDDKDIHFFHASLSDYLFDKSRSGQFWIDAGMVYADLALQCMYQPSNSAWQSDIHAFSVENLPLFFSKATPTLGLHEAIKNCNMEELVRHSARGGSLIFLQAIHDSKFSDAEELYHVHLATYARIIVEPKIRAYLQDPLAHYAFIVTYVVHPLAPYIYRDLKHIFHLSPEMLLHDASLGFGVLSGALVRPKWSNAMKDLLGHPKGMYFIDGNQYADVALYLMKCMTKDSEDVISEIGRTMAIIFPVILSKSSIRHDLIEYIKTKSLSPSYLKYTSILDATTSYISRSEADAKNSSQSLCHDEPEPRSLQTIKASQASESSTKGVLSPRSQTHLGGRRKTPSVARPKSREITSHESLLDGKFVVQTKTSQPSQSMAVPLNKAPSSHSTGSRGPQIPLNRMSHSSQSMTVLPNQAASSGITGSRTPRAATPLQRFLGRFIRKRKEG